MSEELGVSEAVLIEMVCALPILAQPLVVGRLSFRAGGACLSGRVGGRTALALVVSVNHVSRMGP